MTDRETPDASPAEASERSTEGGEGGEPGRHRSRRTVGRPGAGRIMVPWWGLTLLGAGIGFLTADWIGFVFGGLLGFFAWRLR